MISKLSKLGIILTITAGFLAYTVPPAQARRTITCKSHKGRYNYCRVDTRGGVKLSRQISDSSCRQGRTWGYDKEGIWVDRGCSGEFTIRGRGSNNNNNSSSGSSTAAIVGGALVVGAIAAAIASSSGSDSGSSNSDSITCSSKEGGYTRCSADIGRDQVYLKRQLSNSGCWEGDTWGYDPGGIWVDRGCRAEFQISR